MQLPAGVVEQLMAAVEADPALPVTVDLQAREVRAGDVVAPFALDDFTRQRLLDGLDDIGLTLRHDADITVYEQHRPAFLPRSRTA